ncbi:MAG: SGNH/GDSL hydrolase family protein [Vicinamibacterales bacterium]
MFVSSPGRFWVAVFALVAAAACSQTPTGPSAVASAVTPGVLKVEPPPVPPRLAFNPPTALGATRFLAMGDSITAGVLSSFDGMFLYDGSVQSYPARLQLGLNTYHAPQTFTVINRGIPGEWAQDGARRFQTELSNYRPQCVLLLEGINDLNNDQSVSTTVNALRQMLDTASFYQVTVIISTMHQTYESTSPNGTIRDNANGKIAAFNTAIRQAAAGRLNVHVVDMYSAFGSNRSLVGGDGLHPTEDGYQVMATTFLQAIESVWAVRGSFQ